MFKTKLTDPKTVQPGDIIGFSGWHWSSLAINLVTYGLPWCSISHVGIISEHNGETLLFESTTLDDIPCLVKKKKVKGVQAQHLQTRLDGYHGAVWHYPLYRNLYPFEKLRLKQFVHRQLGKTYDQVGAFRSGGYGFSWIESLLREQDLNSLFCSELCAAAHASIGVFRTDNASRWSPNRFTRAERRLSILTSPRRLK